jgi:hypothetical protein
MPWEGGMPCAAAAAAVTPVYITIAMTGLGWHTTQKETPHKQLPLGERERKGEGSRRHGLQRRSKNVKQQGGKSCRGTRATVGDTCMWNAYEKGGQALGWESKRLAREVPTRECGGREAAAEQQRIARVVAVSSRKLAWCYMSLPPHRTPNTFRPLGRQVGCLILGGLGRLAPF